MFGLGLDMGLHWTPLQTHYFIAYLSSIAYSGKGSYSILFVRYPDGWRMALNKDVARAAVSRDPARTGLFSLSDQARLAGGNALEWRFFPDLENATAAQWLRQGIYDNRGPWDFVRWPVLTGVALVTLLLAWIIRPDSKAHRAANELRILRGPHLVTRAQFNGWKHSDGIGFETLEPRTGLERLFLQGSKSRMVCIPRHEENSHFVLAGDSGTGQSSLMRQMLIQFRARGA